MVLAPCGIIGDIDGDGDITQADVDLAFATIEQQVTPEQIKRFDVNGNGRADFNDIVLIGEYARGEITTFPACPAPAITTAAPPSAAPLIIGVVIVLGFLGVMMMKK